MILHIDPRAYEDLNEAFRWLANQGSGLAIGKLWIEWQDGLTSILSTPRYFAIADDAPTGREIRNYLTRKYDYRIVYEVMPGEIVVLAFVRTRRRPSAWINRLTPD